jgi:dihydrofolate reductase
VEKLSDNSTKASLRTPKEAQNGARSAVFSPIVSPNAGLKATLTIYQTVSGRRVLESSGFDVDSSRLGGELGEAPMRRVRYAVAMSLDGYIAGPDGEADWIIMDPDISFRALFEQFDTFLMGRRTFEGMAATGGGAQSGVQTIVFSRTLRQQDYPNVTIVPEDPEQALSDLRSKPGKDIWLFGGGSLFRSLLEARLVDGVETSVIPVLLGEGIPLLPPNPSSERFKLTLTSSRTYKTGIVSLEYAVEYEPA